MSFLSPTYYSFSRVRQQVATILNKYNKRTGFICVEVGWVSLTLSWVLFWAPSTKKCSSCGCALVNLKKKEIDTRGMMCNTQYSKFISSEYEVGKTDKQSKVQTTLLLVLLVLLLVLLF